MAEWIIYVLVGLVVGMNVGYMVGMRRGMLAIIELIGGVFDGFNKARED